MNGLKFFRNYCYVSTNDLAEKLGVSRNLVTMWENGQKELPDKRADEIAAIFGIDKKYLYEIEEEDILHYVEFCERFYNKEEDSYKVTRGDDTTATCLISFNKDYDVFQMEAETRKETNEFLEKMKNMLTKAGEYGKVSEITNTNYRLKSMRSLLRVMERAYSGNATQKSLADMVIESLCRIYDVDSEIKIGRHYHEIPDKITACLKELLPETAEASVKTCYPDMSNYMGEQEYEDRKKELSENELKAF